MLIDQKQVLKPRPPVAIFALADRVSSPDWTPKVRHAALNVARHIRKVLNLPCVEVYSDSLGKAFKKATKEGARYVVIVGEDEIKADSVAIKDLELGTQVVVNNSKLSDILK
jgi:histidyl-tRNA synthetase